MCVEKKRERKRGGLKEFEMFIVLNDKQTHGKKTKKCL
jgi:hypothetical protein